MHRSPHELMQRMISINHAVQYNTVPLENIVKDLFAVVYDLVDTLNSGADTIMPGISSRLNKVEWETHDLLSQHSVVKGTLSQVGDDVNKIKKVYEYILDNQQKQKE